jgi:glutathione peroxidase-family protein
MGNCTFSSVYTPSMGTMYQFNAIDIDGHEQKLSDYSGKICLIINVACF